LLLHHHGRSQGGTWAMVTITLPPTILPTLQKVVTSSSKSKQHV